MFLSCPFPFHSQDRSLLRALLSLLSLGDGPSTTAVTLILIRRLAAGDQGSSVSRALLELGAEQQLERVQQDCPEGLEGSVVSTQQALGLRPQGLQARSGMGDDNHFFYVSIWGQAMWYGGETCEVLLEV